ncbi:MAG: cytochrome c5 family protein [Proteobacteria bacterium]|nr:cytochrome c5 family protein [Pseudomonadota bacterium]
MVDPARRPLPTPRRPLRPRLQYRLIRPCREARRAGEADGEAVYKQLCSSCHQMGIAGAPKLGDRSAWEARIAQGANVLYEHSIKGYTGTKGMMPAKGGNPALSDAKVQAAVDYMVENSR